MVAASCCRPPRLRLIFGSAVTKVVFSPDGTQLATASGSVVRAIDAATGAEICRLDHDRVNLPGAGAVPA